jgi:hypothetical protein
MSDQESTCPVANGTRGSKGDLQQRQYAQKCSPNTTTGNFNVIESRCPIMAQMKECLKNEASGCDGNQKESGVNQRKVNVADEKKACSKCGCCNKATQGVRGPTRSASGNTLGQDSVTQVEPARKTSNISNTSNTSGVSSSGGSDETDGDKKLDLRGLIESIGTLLIPVVSTYCSKT